MAPVFPLEKLETVLDRFRTLEAALASGADGDSFVRLSKDYAEIEPVAKQAETYLGALKEREDLDAMLADPETDSEMRALAEEEGRDLEARIEMLGGELQILLLPKDAADEKSAIVELRPAAGGDEAALFVGDLFRMYQRYAELQGWKVAMLSESPTEIGGFKELAFTVNGAGVFAKLKFESGVHRVQRIPVTESGGRIHTSTATVAVLPEAEEVDVDVADADLKIDTYRASGAGGQHVNTTDSAVRITHMPTGIVVAVQDERSQHKNKAKALKLLRAKIYDIEREQAAAERSADRKDQVGTGDRSERIRTYNFPQGRVTDHRIGLTLYKLDQVIAGDSLNEVVDALIAEHQAAQLAEASATPVL